MGLFGRREKPPAAVTAQVGPDERVLSWADTASGAAVVATNHGLWWPTSDGARRIAWQHVDKAVWRDGVLSVTQADVVEDMLLVERPPVHETLAVPRDLPPVVRKRVEANVAKSEVVPVGSAGAVRFVARRVPGRDGLTWWARLEQGTADTPALRAAIGARLEQLRAQSEALRQQ